MTLCERVVKDNRIRFHCPEAGMGQPADPGGGESDSYSLIPSAIFLRDTDIVI